jgi:hypothetical protein
MINDPILREKLLNRSIDPAFLDAILDNNSKCDLELLKETLKNMTN